MNVAANYSVLLFFCSGIACGKASFLFFCRVGAPPRLKTETDPVPETLCFLFVEIRTMNKVHKLNSNEIISALFIKSRKKAIPVTGRGDL
jgi:hypothetical protein